jgi:hypothetical protein
MITQDSDERKKIGEQPDELVERLGHESGHDANASRKKRDQDDAKRSMMGSR